MTAKHLHSELGTEGGAWSIRARGVRGLRRLGLSEMAGGRRKTHVHVCMYVCVYIYIYIYTYIHVYIYIYTSLSLYIYIL